MITFTTAVKNLPGKRRSLFVALASSRATNKWAWRSREIAAHFWVSLAMTLVIFTLPANSILANDTIPSAQDAILEKIKIDYQVGKVIPSDIVFTDSSGETVNFESFFGTRPIVLVPVYFRCPMLCNLVLKALLKTFRLMRFTAAKEFEVVIFSIDPKETVETSASKKELFLKEYGAGVEASVHVLTGTQENINRLTDAIGFRYTYDPVSNEYAHAASVTVLTPQGKIASYFGGIDYKPRDFRFALIEASGGKIGTIVDKILLTCYHYDPTTGKYGLVITGFLRIFGTATMLIIFGFIFFSLKKDEQKTEMKI